MGEERGEREAALASLRAKLADGLARARLTKTQLAGAAGLSRTTVQEAFRTDAPAPSAETVAAIARGVGLRADLEGLLDLRRTAAGEAGPATARDSGPGRPIAQWDPHDLEVHPAGAGSPHSPHSPDSPNSPNSPNEPGATGQPVLPGYVPRGHDRVLADTVRQAAHGAGRMLVLVGSSSTGKTRACWEAVQPLAAQGWRLWHPFEPTRAEAALADLERVGPRTVVWLNEAQHYLGHPQAGERIAAALHALLTGPDHRPVLVLGTLWPEYVDRFTALPSSAAPDPHSRVRELLSGRTLTVPDAFDREALRAAQVLAEGGDRLLADALARVGAHGRIAQDLAGAPELLRRYEQGGPAVRALLQAAMDARRLGVGLHLPQAFLIDAATDYLTDDDWDHLTDDWAEAAFTDLAHPVPGRQAPLRRVSARPARRPPGGPAPTAVPAAGPVFRLVDYLEHHGRTTRRRLCPPASFWAAAHAHLTRPDDLDGLARAAEDRHRLQWAHHLRRRAAEAGHPGALTDLAERQETAGDREGAAALYRRAADSGHGVALVRLARMRETAGDREGAAALYRRAADGGHRTALTLLTEMRERAGEHEAAESLARRAAETGNAHVLARLAELREEAGEHGSAETLARLAAATGNPHVLARLAELREAAGDHDSAETLARQAAAGGHQAALGRLARIRRRTGNREGAETLLWQAAHGGYLTALIHLGRMREEAGDRAGAAALYRRAADGGHLVALGRLAEMREETGDREGAEALARQAAEAGNPSALAHLAENREWAGDRAGAELLARQAAEAGNPSALARLAQIREEAGRRESAELLARQAAEAGDPSALAHLAERREWAGDRAGAEALARQASEAGEPSVPARLARAREAAGDGEGAEALYRQAADEGRRTFPLTRWPYGLDPDGSPTPPWS
ncbi:hypothetical protein [Kitasatospora sp. NPDC057015]|uniref:hypothetical protein n=1 Tax=Kitasatospora sp. NPDC057015 TaxID=3346001 RepID=UPI0036296ED6